MSKPTGEMSILFLCTSLEGQFAKILDRFWLEHDPYFRHCFVDLQGSRFWVCDWIINLARASSSVCGSPTFCSPAAGKASVGEKRQPHCNG